jgi:hypothetical protein
MHLKEAYINVSKDQDISLCYISNNFNVVDVYTSLAHESNTRRF